MLLYSETANVHMHTLKIAVIELDADRQGFDVEAFRRVIHGRLYKLDPFRYQLVDIPGNHMSCVTKPELGQAIARFLAG